MSQAVGGSLWRGRQFSAVVRSSGSFVAVFRWLALASEIGSFRESVVCWYQQYVCISLLHTASPEYHSTFSARVRCAFYPAYCDVGDTLRGELLRGEGIATGPVNELSG